jgi:probable HAF family extracellular repeat protein
VLLHPLAQPVCNTGSRRPAISPARHILCHSESLKNILWGFTLAPTVVSGYVQRGNHFKAINPPGGLTSYVEAVNRSGAAVGGYCLDECNSQKGQHGFLYDNGMYTNIDYPPVEPGISTTAYGINDKGQIVGGYCPGNPACPPGIFLPPSYGFLDDHGMFTTLEYPGAVSTGANSINNAGTIVGVYDINLTGPHSFLYQNGVYTNIDFPGADITVAGSINNSGVVAGYYEDSMGAIHGFLYLNGKFETVNVPGALNTNLFGLSDQGVIDGTWDNGVIMETFKGIPVR